MQFFFKRLKRNYSQFRQISAIRHLLKIAVLRDIQKRVLPREKRKARAIDEEIGLDPDPGLGGLPDGVPETDDLDQVREKVEQDPGLKIDVMLAEERDPSPKIDVMLTEERDPGPKIDVMLAEEQGRDLRNDAILETMRRRDGSQRRPKRRRHTRSTILKGLGPDLRLRSPSKLLQSSN